ncbi:hypothetical protein PspLS_07362, partial [Pyricularia sp. CBS 133598]
RASQYSNAPVHPIHLTTLASSPSGREKKEKKTKKPPNLDSISNLGSTGPLYFIGVEALLAPWPIFSCHLVQQVTDLTDYQSTVFWADKTESVRGAQKLMHTVLEQGESMARQGRQRVLRNRNDKGS